MANTRPKRRADKPVSEYEMRAGVMVAFRLDVYIYERLQRFANEHSIIASGAAKVLMAEALYEWEQQHIRAAFALLPEDRYTRETDALYQSQASS